MTADREAMRKALADMTSLAKDGAARQHLDRAGILQDPPHGMGRFAECEAPWCVRNQKRIADAHAALASDAILVTEETLARALYEVDGHGLLPECREEAAAILRAIREQGK